MTSMVENINTPTVPFLARAAEVIGWPTLLFCQLSIIVTRSSVLAQLRQAILLWNGSPSSAGCVLSAKYVIYLFLAGAVGSIQPSNVSQTTGETCSS